MTRGGYITIILVLLVMFVFQGFQNDKMFERYEKLVEMNFSAEKTDSTKLELQNITDSINVIKEAFAVSLKKSDTIINKSYVRNLYITPEYDKAILTNDSIELITKYDKNGIK